MRNVQAAEALLIEHATLVASGEEPVHDADEVSGAIMQLGVVFWSMLQRKFVARTDFAHLVCYSRGDLAWHLTPAGIEFYAGLA